jgi:hypothetical protein
MPLYGTPYRIVRPFMRVLCLPRRHGNWQREPLLAALAYSRSKRCKWCNRLVLKKEFR